MKGATLFAEKVDGAALFADGVLQRDAQVVIARKRAAQTRGNTPSDRRDWALRDRPATPVAVAVSVRHLPVARQSAS